MIKVGMVAIIGRPNVGKSTLLNFLLNNNIAITSDKPQTTRNKIKGIYNDEDAQIIFIDTPGIHKPKQKIGKNYNNKSYEIIKDQGVDLVLFLQPLDEKIGPGDRFILENIKDIKKKIFLITKSDKGNIMLIQEKVQEIKKNWNFLDILSISIKNIKSLNLLLNTIKENLSLGEPLYPKNQITDQSISFIAKEVIREFAIKFTNDEIPHSIAVIIDSFVEQEKPKPYLINGIIYVERNSQKGILIGKDGKLIKKIGIYSRKKMSFLFNHSVFLSLKVKVAKKWTNNSHLIKKFGY